MKTASLLVLLPTLGALAAPLGNGKAGVLARTKRADSDVDAIRDIFVVDDEKDHVTTTRVKRGAADIDAIRDIFVDGAPSSSAKAKRGNDDVDAIRDIFVVDDGSSSPKPKRSNGDVDAIRDIFVVGEDSSSGGTDVWIVYKNKRTALKRGYSDIDAIRDIFVDDGDDKVAAKRGTGDVDAIRDIFLSNDNGVGETEKLNGRHTSNPYADDVAAADPKAILGEK